MIRLPLPFFLVGAVPNVRRLDQDGRQVISAQGG
jgi:hypothetical protein